MTKGSEARRVKARFRKFDKQMRRKRAREKDRPHHFTVDVMSVMQGLADPATELGVLQFMKGALDGALGTSDYQMTCFVCEAEWSLDRAPAGLVVMDHFVHEIDRIVSGVCSGCFQTSTIMQRLHRDYPDADFRFKSDGPTTQQ